jgi:hypothetical protein
MRRHLTHCENEKYTYLMCEIPFLVIECHYLSIFFFILLELSLRNALDFFVQAYCRNKPPIPIAQPSERHVI